MRKPKPETDFTVNVDGVGDFVYGRRTIGDSMKIRSRFLELVGNHGDDVELAWLASAVATHEVLCVSAPAGWNDLLTIDSVDPSGVNSIYDLYTKVGEKEDSFRGQTKVGGAQGGSANGADAGVLVSPQVQPAAE